MARSVNSDPAVADRRRKVANLWLEGTAQSAIARLLDTPLRTIGRDLEVIRAELRAAHHAELEDARARSLAVLRLVQQEAWALFRRLPDTSTNRASALSTILAAEQQISKIEGTSGPEVALQQTTVNVLASSEWQQSVALLLRALEAYPEARVAAAAALVGEAGTLSPPVGSLSAASTEEITEESEASDAGTE